MADAMKVITVRVTEQQYLALRMAAAERAVAEGGMADASAIIRELLDRWMEQTKMKRRK
jgi:hypothetical protein